MDYHRPEGPHALTPMVKNLLIINVVLFAVCWFVPSAGQIIYRYGALHFPTNPDYVFTQFITYMFLHSDQNFFHILFNMFALYMFGTAVERVWGWKRFLNYYLACGLGAALIQTFVLYLPLPMNVNAELSVMVGASGAIYGLLAAFGFLYPNNKIYIYFVIPLKAKYFVALMIGMDLMFGISNNPNDNVAHFAHIGGAVTGLVYLFANKLRRKRF